MLCNIGLYMLCYIEARLYTSNLVYCRMHKQNQTNLISRIARSVSLNASSTILAQRHFSSVTELIIGVLFFRQDCSRIYDNDYIQWSEKMLADANFMASVETINSSDETLSRRKRSAGEKKCPTFSEEYLGSALRDQSRSTSPWKFVVDVDNER